MDDRDAQVKLSLHLAEGTHHAWLWTNRIKELGGEPMRVLDGYQGGGEEKARAAIAKYREIDEQVYGELARQGDCRLRWNVCRR